MLNGSIKDKQTARVQHETGAYTTHQEPAEHRRLRAERVGATVAERKGNDSRRYRNLCTLKGHYAAWSAGLKEKDTFNYEL